MRPYSCLHRNPNLAPFEHVSLNHAEMEATLLYRLPRRRDAASANMAIDSALPQLAKKTGGAVLRFYDWSSDALTFGYGQRLEEVLQYAQMAGLPAATGSAVRRPSGGGIVDHRNDVTYAFAISSELPISRLTPAKFYCRLHEALAATLNIVGCPANLAPCHPSSREPTRDVPAACFIDFPAPSDVIARDSGRKIAGAALRRSPCGVLAQGSIDRQLLPSNVVADQLEPVFSAALCSSFDLSSTAAFAQWPEEIPSQEDCLRFASDAWNQRR